MKFVPNCKKKVIRIKEDMDSSFSIFFTDIKLDISTAAIARIYKESIKYIDFINIKKLALFINISTTLY